MDSCHGLFPRHPERFGMGKQEGKMTGSDFADWWDRTVVKNQGPVVTWIKENPGLASIVFTPLIPMAFTGADALVDVARIGEGVGAATSDEATALDVAKGIGADAMRAFSVIPFVRAPGMVVKYGLQQVAVRASLFKAVQGGLCTEIAATQGIRRSAQAIFMDLDAILRKTRGKPLAELSQVEAQVGINFATLTAALKDLRIPFKSLPPPSSFDEISSALKGNDVILFRVKWLARRSNGIEEEATHTLHAFKDFAGRFRISDRTGHIVSSLQELGKLVPGYRGIETAVIYPNAEILSIRGLQVLEVVGQAGIAVFMLPLLPHVVVNADQTTPEMVTQSVEATIMRGVQGKIPATIPPPQAKAPKAKQLKPTIPPVEWLTGVKFRLNHLGYAAGPPVHVYDERCKRAIRQFQRDYGLLADGVPGPQTQAKLRDVCKY